MELTAAEVTVGVGVGLVAVGAAADVGVGVAQLALPPSDADPTLGTLHTVSAATLGGGIGVLAAGGLLAAGDARRRGAACPTWTGWTALGLEVVGVGLVLADPVLVAAGEEPLPWPADWVKLAALPFAVAQLDAARGATPVVVVRGNGLALAGRW